MGVGAEHGFRQLIVGYLDSKVFDFLVDQSLLNHLVEDILLQSGRVHLCVLLLVLLVNFLVAALKFLNVDFFFTYLCDSGAGAEQGASRSEEVTDDEREQSSSDDDE